MLRSQSDSVSDDADEWFSALRQQADKNELLRHQKQVPNPPLGNRPRGFLYSLEIQRPGECLLFGGADLY